MIDFEIVFSWKNQEPLLFIISSLSYRCIVLLSMVTIIIIFVKCKINMYFLVLQGIVVQPLLLSFMFSSVLIRRKNKILLRLPLFILPFEFEADGKHSGDKYFLSCLFRLLVTSCSCCRRC